MMEIIARSKEHAALKSKLIVPLRVREPRAGMPLTELTKSSKTRPRSATLVKVAKIHGRVVGTTHGRP